MAHSKEAHAKMKAMPQFNEGHWEKKLDDVTLGGGRYASEMNTEQEYKHSVNELSNYVKKHRMKY